MSQEPFPNYPNPELLSYATPNFESPRPKTVTVMAIIGIVLGSLGVLCNALGMLGGVVMIVMGKTMGKSLPGGAIMDPTISVINLVQTVIMFGLSLTLLIACIGAMKLKPLAHKAIMTWSMVVIAWAVATTIVQIVWVGPLTMEWVKRTQPGNPMAMGMFGRTYFISMAFVSLVLYCTLPVLYLILWRRPNVKKAFQNRAANPPT